jgi:hypothetical protein
VASGAGRLRVLAVRICHEGDDFLDVHLRMDSTAASQPVTIGNTTIQYDRVQ